MKTCAVVYNPNSGKGKKASEFVETVETVLKESFYETSFFPTKEKGDAIKIISELEDNFDLVIVAGGDGTLNEAMSGNLKRKQKFLLAALPVGTTNDVGVMYGYTANYKKDIKLLLNGTVKKIDTCFINKTPFLYAACLGNYVDVAYSTPRSLKEKYGKLGYALYGAKKIHEKLKHYHIEYEIDGKTYQDQFSFIFITNTSRMAGINHLYEDVKLNDGMFEVAFCKLKKKSDLITIFPSLLTMSLKNVTGVTYYRTNHLKIKFLEPLEEAWGLDGEEFKTMENEFEFSVVQEMEMLVPVKNVNKLFNEVEQ